MPKPSLTPPPSLLDRIFTHGPDTLTLEELYSVLLDIPPTEIRQLVATLLQAPTVPRTLPGLTTEQIGRAVAIGELITRQQNAGKDRLTFWSPEEVATFFQSNGYVTDKSQVYLLLFDAEYRLINAWYTPLHQGLPTLVTIRPADIHREAIRHQARSVVLVHALATRNPTPTEEALDFVRAVIQTAATLEIRILDYLTIGTKSFHALSRHPDFANPPLP